MRKILFLGMGSAGDPGFGDTQIYGKPFREYMVERGVAVIEDVVESCHGCPELMKRYSATMQKFVERRGDRVAAVLQGGLLFGLPSIQATQVTYPIISCPLDYIAYTAFMVPTGHAVIAGVGIMERKKALVAAERMLNLEDEGVRVMCDTEGKLEAALKKHGVPANNNSGLALAYGNTFQAGAKLIVAADLTTEKITSANIILSEQKQHSGISDDTPIVYVRGAENLAIYAMKILSLRSAALRQMVKKIRRDKSRTYTKRDLEAEIGRLLTN